MLDDLIALGPSRPQFIEVEAAFRELRRSQKFMPSICEIVQAIERQEAEWEKQYDAVHTIEVVHAELVEAIANAEQLIAAKAELERRRRKQLAIENKPSPPMASVGPS